MTTDPLGAINQNDRGEAGMVSTEAQLRFSDVEVFMRRNVTIQYEWRELERRRRWHSAPRDKWNRRL